MESPAQAKNFTIRGILRNIVRGLVPIWADPARVATQQGKKILVFLLDIISCIRILSPEHELILPQLDERLLPALGHLCASCPALVREYPELGGEALKALLDDKPILDLCILARDLGEDTSRCKSTTEIIQVLLESGKALEFDCAEKGLVVVNTAMSERAALMALYNATGGSAWKRKLRWGSSAPLEKWEGVTVDDDGRVTRLYLAGNNLKGVYDTVNCT